MCYSTVPATRFILASHSETHGHVRYVVVSGECHLLCEVCSKLEVVQVDHQTVYYVGESTVHCFYEELHFSLQCMESTQMYRAGNGINTYWP